jgi:hypothetical protein
MTPTNVNPAPSSRQLFAATGAAAAAAALLLVVAVLPAEHGIDPTGIGKRLGLQALARTAAPPSAPAPAASAHASGVEALKAQALAAFGAQPGQNFDASAAVRRAAAPKTEAMTVMVPPGYGVEVKAQLAAGDSLVYRWIATGDVTVDMHGERPGAKDEFTTFLVDAARREDSGHFTAPFTGAHGWYWLNKGRRPVNVTVSVTGFQSKLYVPE